MSRWLQRDHTESQYRRILLIAVVLCMVMLTNAWSAGPNRARGGGASEAPAGLSVEGVMTAINPSSAVIDGEGYRLADHVVIHYDEMVVPPEFFKGMVSARVRATMESDRITDMVILELTLKR